MPGTAVEDNNRMSLRIKPRDKATIMRASALAETDMTDFIVRTALRAARALIDRSERVVLSERDSLRVLDLLENPPPPNDKLLAAVRALPARRVSFSDWHEEPIGKGHDRAAFDCGQAALNDYRRRHARKNHERGASKTILAIANADRTSILGYYSLSPASIGSVRVPKIARRGSGAL